ncbi:hypothetical protein [Burkholderia sp. 22313]
MSARHPVNRDGADFSRAITYIAAMALAGSLSRGLLVGKVERIDA